MGLRWSLKSSGIYLVEVNLFHASIGDTVKRVSRVAFYPFSSETLVEVSI